MRFNGVSLFAQHQTGGGEALFGGSAQSASRDNTLTIFTSADGAAGSKVSLHKSVLLSALTFNTRHPCQRCYSDGANGSGNGDETTRPLIATFATESGGDSWI